MSGNSPQSKPEPKRPGDSEAVVENLLGSGRQKQKRAVRAQAACNVLHALISCNKAFHSWMIHAAFEAADAFLREEERRSDPHHTKADPDVTVLWEETEGYCPEPWVVGDNDPTMIFGVDGRRLVHCAAYRMPTSTDRANARRICDCVNALAGIGDPRDFRRDLQDVLGFVLDWLRRLNDKQPMPLRSALYLGRLEALVKQLQAKQLQA